MIQVSDKSQQAIFTHYNYPELSTLIVDCINKQVKIHNGILSTSYSIEKIDEKMIIHCFGEKIGNEIILLCKSVSGGNKLSVRLMKDLEITGEDKCDSQELLDVSF